MLGMGVFGNHVEHMGSELTDSAETLVIVTMKGLVVFDVLAISYLKVIFRLRRR